MKDKNTTAVLALLLGGLGAHRFYLGQWVWGLVYLVFCFTFIPMLVSLVEAVILFSMSEAKFQAKYAPAESSISMEGKATPDTHVRCPDCRELVRRDARKCRFCGAALVPQ